MLGQLDFYLQKNQFGPYLILNTKINPKCIKDQILTAKTAELLEENIGVNLHDLGLGNDFLSNDANCTRKQINLTSSKLKTFIRQSMDTIKEK